MIKILVGSPVRQKAKILNEFLVSLSELNKENLQVDYYFVNDNEDNASAELLYEFQKHNNTILKEASDYNFNLTAKYDCNNVSHVWKKNLIEKITTFKNDIITYARDNNYDYLFFIDSDIVLHKDTLLHLVSRQVDIVSNLFWTQWYPNQGLNPQVWLQDEGKKYVTDWDDKPTILQQRQMEIDFVTKMRLPGLYEVGGLGACTLISKKALEKGVSFSIIDNVSFWGEDRHFCIRAEVLGFKLYVDTVYPAYHIYREEYLSRVDEFKKDGFKFDMCMTTSQGVVGDTKKQKIIKLLKKIKHKLIIRKINKFNAKRVTNNNRIVFSAIVHNEGGKYLERVLERVKECVDDILIIDDASTDNTVEIIEKSLKDFPHVIIKNKKSMFHKEYKLRMKQWKETLKLNPGWILTLDADEVPCESFAENIKKLIQIDNVDVFNFKLYDMWNETDYREDQYWQLHNRFMTRLLRYQPKFKYKFKKTNQHCGTFPKNINMLTNANVDVKIKHYGWATPEIREAKYNRYMKLDKDGKFGEMNQYKSILDPNPTLKVFKENE